ncbi:HDA11 deacetylase, partial [Polypterus senegalus]
MSQRLTREERTEIVLMSGERSNRVIAADFSARHPTSPPISHATVSKLLAKFRETGSVLDLPKCGRMKTVTNEETSVAVLASFSKSPQRSTHRMSLESGISRTFLRRILATHKWHPYNLQLLQHLNEDDPDRRTEFAEWAKQKLEQDPPFTHKILFSDEANFYVNGEVNKQNRRYWSDTNPHWIDPSKTVGTKKLMAGKLAIERGWAINVGGGFHHCSSDKGGGFCAYADITLAIKGNGHERDFMDDSRVYIMDVYNRYIYPGDGFAKRAIKRKIELDWGTEDQEYLEKVDMHVQGALNEVRPDILIYNAGTDILDGDPLGGLAISAQGIVKRDEIIFKAARERNIPILMVTSGGYQKRTARIIADSIINLHNLGLVDCNAASSEAGPSRVSLLMNAPLLAATQLSSH